MSITKWNWKSYDDEKNKIYEFEENVGELF